MPSKERISRQQLMWMYANGLWGSSLLFLPQVLVATAKQDAWITAILGGIAGLAQLALYVALARRFPRRSPVEYFIGVLGRPIGVLAMLALFTYLYWLVLVTQREITDFFAINYPETPVVFVTIAFTILATYLLLGGIEVIARVHDLLFPLIIGGTLLWFILAIPEFHVQSLQPVLAGGIKPVLDPLPSHLIFPYGNAIAFLMIFPYLRKQKDLPFTSAAGSLIGTAILVLSVLFPLLTLGPSSTARVVYPPHFAARTITILGFLAGIDGLVDAIWIASNTLRTVIFTYASLLIMSELLGISSYRYLVIPMATLSVVSSLNTYNNFAEHLEFLHFTEIYLAHFVDLFVPLLVLIIALLRGIKGRRLDDE